MTLCSGPRQPSGIVVVGGHFGYRWLRLANGTIAADDAFCINDPYLLECQQIRPFKPLLPATHVVRVRGSAQTTQPLAPVHSLTSRRLPMWAFFGSPAAAQITFVRDPVSRVVSHWYHHRQDCLGEGRQHTSLVRWKMGAKGEEEERRGERDLPPSRDFFLVGFGFSPPCRVCFSLLAGRHRISTYATWPPRRAEGRDTDLCKECSWQHCDGAQTSGGSIDSDSQGEPRSTRAAGEGEASLFECMSSRASVCVGPLSELRVTLRQLEFASKPRNQNVQSRYLQGAPLDNLLLLGVTERFAESLQVYPFLPLSASRCSVSFLPPPLLVRISIRCRSSAADARLGKSSSLLLPHVPGSLLSLALPHPFFCPWLCKRFVQVVVASPVITGVQLLPPLPLPLRPGTPSPSISCLRGYIVLTSNFFLSLYYLISLSSFPSDASDASSYPASREAERTAAGRGERQCPRLHRAVQAYRRGDPRHRRWVRRGGGMRSFL